jgi:NAD(P)-dependent dehydrogenase (short-subunit alcohol dehydrogenase family)
MGKGVMSLFDLSGKVGIVTGGGRSIGKSLALALADEGADIVIATGHSMDSAEKVAEEIREKKRASLALKVDVSSRQDVQEMTSKVLEEFGKIDFLVNNAAINIFGPAEDFSLADWNKVLGVDLTGVFLCSQAVGRVMMEQGRGKIVNIASVGGMSGTYRKAVAYDASKAGVINLTRSLAVEWGKYHINVNAVAPGMIESDLTRKRLEDRSFSKYFVERVPLQRIGRPEDLAGIVIFLCSHASDWITGQTIIADGGQTLLDLSM